MRQNWNSLREFEALRAVIAAGTTTGAARRLGISQSAVSRSLAQLEARTGRILFEREAGRIRPTAEALKLNTNLDPLFDALARVNGGAWARESGETLRLVAPPTIAHRFLLKRIAAFHKTQPDLMVSLEVCTSDDIVGGILDDRFEVGLTSANLTRSGLRLIPYRHSRAVCVMPTGHPLTKEEVITPELLDGQPMIALARRHGVRAIFDQAIAKSGATPRIVAESATSVAACEFTRAGMGVTVINPFPLIRGTEPGIEVRPFEPVIEYRTSFAISTFRPLSGAARAFLRHIRMTTGTDPYSTPL